MGADCHRGTKFRQVPGTHWPYVSARSADDPLHDRLSQILAGSLGIVRHAWQEDPDCTRGGPGAVLPLTSGRRAESRQLGSQPFDLAARIESDKVPLAPARRLGSSSLNALTGQPSSRGRRPRAGRLALRESGFQSRVGAVVHCRRQYDSAGLVVVSCHYTFRRDSLRSLMRGS